ncbi:ABC-type transport auxiliary lipoprotein family protein [Lysobacter koreensis]
MTIPTPTLRGVARAGVLLAAGVLLGGCALLGGKSRQQGTIYAPEPRVAADARWPTVRWQLSMSPPSAARMIDSLRIAVRPTPNEIQVYKDANWAQRPSDMLEATLLRTLEDSGKIPAVARQGSGISADYKLVLDLRRFEADYAPGAATPAATIEVNAKLLHAQDQQVVAAHTFVQAQPSASTAVPDVVTAFERSLGAISQDLAGWVLTSGDGHERGGVHR